MRNKKRISPRSSIATRRMYLAVTLLCGGCASVPQLQEVNPAIQNPNGDDKGGGSKNFPTPEQPSENQDPSAVVVTDLIDVPAVRKADLLFIVDNSGSMSNEHQVLRDSFNGFINSFITKQIDANIGVISTDVRAANGANGTWTNGGYAPNYPEAGPGRLLSRLSNERFLNTASSSDLSNKFRSNVDLGVNGSGDERALNSLLLALDPSMIAANGYNQNFIRDGALFTVIIVGDEDNGLSPNEFSVSNAHTVIDAAVNRVNALKSTTGGSRFEFVINKSVALPNPMPSYANNISSIVLEYPAVFREFATSLSYPESRLIDIETDFAPQLAAMGESISSQVLAQFALSQPAIAESIKVSLDAVEVAGNSDNGWTYVLETNSVELHGDLLRNATGHRLSIVYTKK